MREPDVNHLPDHVRRNRERWDEWAHDYIAAGEKSWASENPAWGIWGVPESDVGLLPGRSRGQGCHRTRLRHRVCLRVDGPARRARRRHRQLRGAARHGAAPAARARPRLPAAPRQRRSGPATPTRASTSPSPSTAPASGPIRSDGCRRRRACCVPAAGCTSSSNSFLLALCTPEEDGVAGHGSAAAPGVRHVPHRVARRSRASSSTSRTAIGSACCEAPGSRSRI